MKITIVVGGRWHAFDLARALHQQGHLHRLITNYPRWFVRRWGIPNDYVVSLPFTFWLVKIIYKLGGESLMMRCQWWIHRWFAERAVNYLKGSDLIHGWSQWSEPSLRWAREHRIPTVLERSSAHILEQSRLLHEEHARHGLQWSATHPQIEAMELREYSLCSQVAVPSLFVERSFQERGFPQNHLFRNALGVNLDQFQPPAEPPPPPEKGGLHAIYAGSLSVRKGIPDLLAGFEAAALANAQLTLVGANTPELTTLLSQQPKNVRQLGHRPQAELMMHYGRAHCFVMASVEEGMAMVQMQALACGLPLICTKNSGGEDLLRMGSTTPELCPEGVEQFPAGFLVPIQSPKALAWCLRQIAMNPGLWGKQRKAALELATANLSWETYGDRSLANYKRLLESIA